MLYSVAVPYTYDAIIVDPETGSEATYTLRGAKPMDVDIIAVSEEDAPRACTLIHAGAADVGHAQPHQHEGWQQTPLYHLIDQLWEAVPHTQIPGEKMSVTDFESALAEWLPGTPLTPYSHHEPEERKNPMAYPSLEEFLSARGWSMSDVKDDSEHAQVLFDLAVESDDVIALEGSTGPFVCRKVPAPFYRVTTAVREDGTTVRQLKVERRDANPDFATGESWRANQHEVAVRESGAEVYAGFIGLHLDEVPW